MVKISHPIRSAAIATGLLAAAGGAGAALLQRRHVGQIRRDPENERLGSPPRGRVVKVRSADGTELHAEVFGDPAGQPVLLAHGWTEGLEYWTYVIEDLVGAGMRPIAFDLRGHGASGPAAGGTYDLERFGEDIEAVLSACLAEDERAVVVGHSLGGMSVVAWAQAHDVESRACAAALCMTGMDGLIADTLALPVLAGRVKHTVGRVFMGAPGPLPRVSTPFSHASIRFLAFGPAATAAQVAFYERMLWRTHPRARTAIGVALSSLDLAEALTRLTVPTAVIAGAKDRLTPPVHARRMTERLPDAHLVELPDTGHMGPLERPREVSRAILAMVPNYVDAH